VVVWDSSSFSFAFSQLIRFARLSSMLLRRWGWNDE